MPNRLKSDLSGKDILKYFETHYFYLERMKGSHMVMKRLDKEQKQILIIPNHKIISKGTLKAVISQAERYISIENLKKFFYTD